MGKKEKKWRKEKKRKKVRREEEKKEERKEGREGKMKKWSSCILYEFGSKVWEWDQDDACGKNYSEKS